MKELYLKEATGQTSPNIYTSGFTSTYMNSVWSHQPIKGTFINKICYFVILNEAEMS